MCNGDSTVGHALYGEVCGDISAASYNALVLMPDDSSSDVAEMQWLY
jgi:hypothetical protein